MCAAHSTDGCESTPWMFYAQEAKAMNIRVEQICKLERGLLRDFATVNVGGIRISHIRIVHPEGREPFMGVPKRSYQTNDGGRRYSNVVALPDDLKKKVETAVLSFWGQQRHGLLIRSHKISCPPVVQQSHSPRVACGSSPHMNPRARICSGDRVYVTPLT
jgi:hypothetical protein